MARPLPTKQSPARFVYLIAGVLLLVLFIYWPAMRGALLWDDPSHVTRPSLRSLGGLAKIWFQLGATQQYYPVLHSAFWFESHFFGDATAGYHAINILLHVAAACLFAAAIRSAWSIGGPNLRPLPRGAEWIAAFLFAIHPVCVESVAWISEQKNTLSLVFYLSSAIAYFRYRKTSSIRFYWLASTLFLLALGSKTVTASLPAALLVILWWRQGRIDLRKDLLPLVPWFIAAVVAGLTTAWVEKHYIGASGAAFEVPVVDRAFLASRVVWHYLRTILWPIDLLFFYPHWDASRPGVIEWASLVALVVFTLVLWLIRSRGKGPLAAWLLFVGGLFPALGFVNVYPFQFSYVADHFQYLPNLAIFALLAYACARLASAKRHVAVALAATLGVCLCVSAHLQAGLYVDNVTLFRATLAKNPRSWQAHNILGAAMRDAGQSDDAIAEFRTSIQIEPNAAYAHLALGTELAHNPATHEEAIAEMRRAISIRPNYSEAYNALGLELDAGGKLAEAKEQFETAIKLNPALAEAHYNLGRLFASQPDGTAAAVSEFEAAIRVRPYFAPAHAELGNILAKSGQLSDAISHYRTAIASDPSVPWFHRNLAMALSQIPGGIAEAVDEAEEAITLAPTNAESHNALAILCAQQGEFAKARSEWEEALRLNPNYGTARQNLARLQQMSH